MHFEAINEESEQLSWIWLVEPRTSGTLFESLDIPLSVFCQEGSCGAKKPNSGHESLHRHFAVQTKESGRVIHGVRLVPNAC